MKGILRELEPIAHSWCHRQLYFYFSPLVLFRSSLAGSGGAISRPTLFSYSRNPLLKSEAFLPLFRRLPASSEEEKVECSESLQLLVSG